MLWPKGLIFMYANGLDWSFMYANGVVLPFDLTYFAINALYHQSLSACILSVCCALYLACFLACLTLDSGHEQVKSLFVSDE